LVDAESIWIPFGIFIGSFQLGCFWGPVFATVQEIAPQHIRATLIAFYILTLNLLGLAVGAVAAGMSIDYLREANVAEPYTWSLLALGIFGFLSIPCFYLAAKEHYKIDKVRE